MSSEKKIVVAGGSVAGHTVARGLRAGGHTGPIVVIDADPAVPYRRPDVSKGLLSGRLSTSDVSMGTADAIEYRPGRTLTALDRASRRVYMHHAGQDEAVDYDHLVIATGCSARIPQLASGIGGVHVLRAASDAFALRDRLATAERLVVIGAGFIGLEAATVAHEMGKDVTIVEREHAPLLAVLGDEVGRFLLWRCTDLEIDVRVGRSVVGFATDASGRATSVNLDDGSELAADAVLMAVGSTPATAWLEGSGVPLDDGVLCTPMLTVDGDEALSAVGDLTRWTHPLYDRRVRVEHWTNALEQGTYVAKRLLSDSQEELPPFEALPYFWSEQLGNKLQSVGLPSLGPDVTVIRPERDSILAIYGRDGRVAGVAGFGVGAQVIKLRRDVTAGVPVEELHGSLVELYGAARTVADPA